MITSLLAPQGPCPHDVRKLEQLARVQCKVQAVSNLERAVFQSGRAPLRPHATLVRLGFDTDLPMLRQLMQRLTEDERRLIPAVPS